MAAVICSKCGTRLADGAMFCHSCGTRSKPPQAPLQLQPKAMLPQQSVLTRDLSKGTKNILKALAGLIIVFWIFTKVCSGPSEADKAHKEGLEATAVQAVKDNFDPNQDMLLLNVDTATGNWYAIDDSGVHECQGECFVVFYTVDVMPSGATEKKRMEFKWLYDTKQPLPTFANTEARTYFQSK